MHEPLCFHSGIFFAFIVILSTGQDLAQIPQLMHLSVFTLNGLSVIMHLSNSEPINLLLILGHLPIASFSMFFSRLMISSMKRERSFAAWRFFFASFSGVSTSIMVGLRMILA